MRASAKIIDEIRADYIARYAAPRTELVEAIAVEIEARLPDGTARRTANFYHLNGDGRIQRLSVYMQSG